MKKRTINIRTLKKDEGWRIPEQKRETAASLPCYQKILLRIPYLPAGAYALAKARSRCTYPPSTCINCPVV
jgi:hypothetical protein